MKSQTTRRLANAPEEPAMKRTTFSRLVLAVLLLGALAVPASRATTATFRQGASGYAGARDTMLQQAQPNLNNGTAAAIGWDSDDPNGTGQDIYTLLRFDDVFGGGAGQVPFGAQITQATLTYYVSDTGDAGELRLPLVAWEDTATYTSFCGGDGCNEGEEFGPSTGSAPAAATGAVQVDVTAVVQGWSDGQANRGWFVYPTGAGGVDISSSDNGTTTNRPLLTIRYNEGPPSSALVRDPYLQSGTPTSMTVAWRTTTSTASVVEYGTVFGSYPFSATGAPGIDHFVTISSLSPGTRYYYRLGTSGTQGGGLAEHYFVTSPPTGTAQPFRFWVFGDSGICSPIQTTVLNSMLTYTATNGPRPDLFLHTGDVVQSVGADDEYTNCLFAYYKDVMRHTPFWPAEGNHDSYSTSCSGTPLICTGPYFSTFMLPTNGEAGGQPSGTEVYYSWDYGNTHFIVLDGTHDRGASSPMAQWLQQDLASSSAQNAQWIIAYWHQPPYTKGTHNSDTEIECIEMRENINPILEAGGVDLVLNGHSHGYERSYLIDGTYSTPTPTFSTLVSQGHILDSGPGSPADPYSKPAGAVPHAGTVYAVVASGGATTGGSRGHPVMYTGEATHGSALVDVAANSLTLTFLRSDGVVYDKFVIEKGPQAPRVSQTDPPKSAVRGSLPSVAVVFTTDVTGVDAGDLTVNGSPATALQQNGAAEYVFTGYATPEEGLVEVVLAPGGITELGGGGLAFEGDAWSYTIDTSPPVVITEIPRRNTAIGALHRITVTFSKPVVNVTPDDLTVNGSSATQVDGTDGTPGPYLFSGFATPGDGLVTVVLNADGIQDDQQPPQPFAGDTWIYELTRRLIINEFLASNNTAAQDENGEYDDYLEIYNPTREPVDMSGMYLTDDLDSPAMYRIPDGVVVPAFGHLVFWCDSQPGQGPLHTNFNILRAGEDLGLFDTEANGVAPIDTFTFTTQTTDVASGRFPDGAEGFVAMPVTPGAANTIACTQSSECAALTAPPCATGVCSGNRCVLQAENEGGACDDGIACTDGDLCVAGVCNNGTDNCPPGEACNRVTGICEELTVDPLPILGSEGWHYFKATAEPTPADLTAWTAIDFDDSGWPEGPSGFGYGPDCDTTRGTLLSDMSGSYLGIYTRKLFQVDDPARVTSLTLTIDFDDAYLVYLNGVEVARSATMGGTAGVPPPYNHALVGGTNHECSDCNETTCNPAAVIDLTSSIGLLVPGHNAIAIRGHNVSLTSSDFTLLATLASTELAGCTFNSDCDDDNPCTDDVCESNICSNTADDGNFCSDANPCTDDACSAGVCTSVPDDLNVCTDGVACTDDACIAGDCVATDGCTPPQSCNYATGICETATTPVTVTFQEGFGAYAGTVDTFLHAGSATADNSAATTLVVDGPAGSGVPADERQVLIRFEQLFASAGGPIPDGATIQSATLTVWLTNASVDGAAFHRMLVPWLDTANWSGFGAGVQQDGSESVAVADVTSFLNQASVFHDIDVTSSLAAWSAGQANHGWVLISPPAGTSDSWQFTSSEGSTAAQRPRLSVTYTEFGCGSDLDCDDGNPCTDDTCDIGTGICDHANDDGNTCTDGVACTADACSAGACVSTDACTGGQVCNHTTGLCETPPPIDPLPIEPGESWNYLKGTAEPTPGDLTAWTRLSYDDSAWLAGPSGFGYGSDCSASRGTTLSDMQNPPSSPGYVSLYLRKEFWVANPAQVLALTLTADYDDAFVVYLNGTEVARRNVTGTPPAYSQLATADHECSVCGGTCNPPEVIDLTAFRDLLVAGTNVVAIQAHNLTLNSSDFTILPSLTSTETSGCTSDPECDNGLYCDGVETCNLGTGVCQNGTPPDCSDGVDCTIDSCDEGTDSCLHQADDAACDDSDLCTIDDCDPIQGCQSVPVDCNDGVACTDDACDPGTGCSNVDNCPGGQVCNYTTGLCETPPPIDPLPIEAGESWSYFKGTAEPTPADLTAWTRLAYDDSAWLAGPSGFGYGTDCAAGHGTVLSDMQNAYLSVYMRKLFWVANPAQVATLTMTADYDDAFVVYINGTEVVRRNVTGTPPAYNQVATADHECSSCNATCNPAEGIDLTAFRSLLVAGTNVIAIQAHNLTAGSTDFTILPTLSSTETSGCTGDPDCDNGLFCDGEETCNTGTGFCEAGTPPSCDDGVPCTVDTCDEGADTCTHQADDAACEDGNLCTINSCDLLLGCQSAGVDCDDGVACTDDACDPGSGCSNVDNCAGGLVCNLSTGVCEISTTPVTLTFQDGFGSYAGTHDTLIHQASPAVNYGADEAWGWDLEDPAPNAMTGLIRFSGILGSAAGQIPPGSTIQSATLTITVFDPSVTPAASVNEVAVDWDEGTVSYDTFGGDPGVQADEYGALVGTGPIANGAFNLDVTSSLSAWAADPASNRGWIFRPASTNGVDVRSSEYLATPAERPVLSVTFIPPVTGPAARMTCDLGSATASPNGSVGLDVWLENLGGMPGVRGYQTQIEILRTSGTGTLAVSCPGGVAIDDLRTDFLFHGLEHFPATNCGLARASSSLREGSVVVDGTPDYLSDYLLAVSADATVGSTFEIRISTAPGSDLADENSDPIPFETGPACVLTIAGCGTDEDCDDGNPCTDDTCDAGTCLHENNTDPCDDGDLCTTGDSCSAGTCAGTPVTCDDNSACTTDSCDAGTGACRFDPITCDDGSVCTTDSCDTILGCLYLPISCDDANLCTADSCDAVLGCQYVPSGSCGVGGTVRYYRNGTVGEPSAKPTPNVAIDVDEDTVSEDVTDATGIYGVASLAGRVMVETLPKWGGSGASDHNGAVTSYDATLIARHVVGTQIPPLSSNQQIAGDVSGNGSLSSYDASLVAQFAVELIAHLPVATTRGSDWRFFRCDNYVSESNHDCSDPEFLHNPLTGTPTDDFYALLFGDVSGNWEAGAFGFAARRPTDAEASFRAADVAERARLRAAGYRLPVARPGGASLTLDDALLAGAAPGQRRRLPISIDGADGIQALDLAFSFDPGAIAIVGVEKGALAARLQLVEGRQPGRLSVALWGTEALEGAGEILVLTIEVQGDRASAASFGIDAVANEGAIPLTIDRLRADPEPRLPAKLLPR